MSDADVPFVQPLAELTVRGHDADTTHLFTLRLTGDTLTLMPSLETGAAAAGGAPAGLEEAPALMRWIGTHWLGAGLPAAEQAFRPHPLRETHVTLAGPYLHVRLGAFDAEYGPGEFDPEAAAAFVQQYDAARRQDAR